MIIFFNCISRKKSVILIFKDNLFLFVYGILEIEIDDCFGVVKFGLCLGLNFILIEIC